MRYALATIMSTACLAGAAAAQEAASGEIENVRGPNSEAIIATKGQLDHWYNGAYGFAPAHRAGDYLFFSGVVAGAPEDETLDEDGFKASVRRAFENIGLTLAKAGADFDAVVKLNTYHVFDAGLTTLDKRAQLRALAEVKNDYIGEPHPAWTAVGVTALLPDRALVEIEIVAYAPQTPPLVHPATDD